MSDPIPPRSGSEPPSPYDPPSSDPSRSPFDRPDAPTGTGPGDPGSLDPPPPRPGPGVRKPLLIGCGVILFLLVAMLALFYANQDTVVAWMLEAIHTEVEPRLPEDLPEDARARYEDAFEMAVASAREGSYTPEGLQRIQRELTAAVQGGGSRLSVEEVERLAEALEAFGPGGGSSPARVEAPDA